MACLARVTDPKEEISFTREASNLKALHFGRSTDFLDTKK